MRRSRASMLVLLAYLGHAAVVSAQALSDPTRPPTGWLPGDPKAPKAATTAEPAEPVQLLLVGKTRHFAIVRGDLIDERSKGNRIVGIHRNELIVQSDRGRETLNLFPDVQKTPPKKPAGMGKKE